jgi:NlpC/P60 family protein
MTLRPPGRRPRAAFALATALLCLQLGGALAGPAAAAGSSSFRDVPNGYWAGQSIRTVAVLHPWMRDFGTSYFKPDTVETRKRLARAVVRVFAPTVSPDPKVRFGDMSADDPYFSSAVVAVQLGWIRTSGPDHDFRPNDPVTTLVTHRALVLALGLRDVVRGINAIHTTDGYRFEHPSGLGAMLTGMLLGIRYNHSDNARDVGPNTRLARSEVAWSLYHAYIADTSESWRKAALAPYETIHLGPISNDLRRVVEFGLKYVGYPYVYAGEWNTKSPSGYCCGYQSNGGFDCSGLMWWVMKAPQSGYDNTRVRPYRGWPIPQRSSADMAGAIPNSQRLTFRQVRAGDLMFYDGDGDGTIDHVDLDLGYGWALDSSNGSGGVVVVRVKSGWYADHFKWGRDIVQASP